MKYKGVVISDIHFGAIDANILRNELEEIFLYNLINMKQLDFIIIDGDYFHRKLYLNEKDSDYAILFMHQLVNIAKEKNAVIRIIYGTESHEVNQYGIFDIHKISQEINFKIIYTVEEEELLPGLFVLYLPEEYMYSKNEHYKDYFSNKNKYDYIFGHGVIVEIMTMASRPTKENKDETRKKVPSFYVSDLTKICKGQSYFGHYHIHTNIDDKIFYVGSYSRWIHGEEEPKGFYIISCDTDKHVYKNKFIENYLAKKYITYTYGYNSSIMSSQEELLRELETKDKLTEMKNGDHVKYVFNIPEDHPNPEFIINILNERYKFNDSIKVQVTNGYTDKKKKINKKKLVDALSEYPMIFDKSIKIENKIEYFIKKKHDREIRLENIKKYLYE